MAKCVLCGSKVSFFSETNTNYDILNEIYIFSKKNNLLPSYMIDSKSFFTDDALYCTECQQRLYSIKKGKDFESAYTSLKSSIATNSIKFPRFGKSTLTKYVDSLYDERKNNERIFETKKRLEIFTENRWESLQLKYKLESFVFPNLEKHAHVCAAKYDNNLILVENRNPKLNLYGYMTEKECENIFEKFSGMEDETIFSISIIPLENIVSYQSTGYVEHTTTISGGGGHGGGVNKKGAILGGLLLGGAGAIVGSQLGTEIFINPITSNVIEYDYRRTMLNLKNAQGQVEIKELPYYYAEVFQKVIPEKEFNFLHANKNTEVQAAPVSNTNMLEEMKQLKELLDIGLITQEEFDSKRKQILKL